MAAPIIVVGHRNPDNDAISAAIGYAWLKNELARRDAEAGGLAEGEEVPVYVPARLGPLPPELPVQTSLIKSRALPPASGAEGASLRLAEAGSAPEAESIAAADIIDTTRRFRSFIILTSCLCSCIVARIFLYFLPKTAINGCSFQSILQLNFITLQTVCQL